MTDTAPSTGPLAFGASFPREERFASTAGEIAGRLAASAGCAEQAADEIRGAVDAAFREALAAGGARGSGIEVTVRPSGGTFNADLASGTVKVLHCSRTCAG
jgi:hypothetical protein